MERRLAAILAADMAGHSRLMEKDEAGDRQLFQNCLPHLRKLSLSEMVRSQTPRT